MNALDCSHDPISRIGLACRGRVHVSWCRSCSEWVLGVSPDVMTGGGGRDWNGNGLESYRVAVVALAQTYPAFDDTAYLYDLGGHAAEVDTKEAQS